MGKMFALIMVISGSPQPIVAPELFATVQKCTDAGKDWVAAYQKKHPSPVAPTFKCNKVEP